MATLQIDVEAVNSAVNRIDTLTSDIETRTQKFLDLVSEKNEESNNSVALITELQKKLVQEQENITKLVEAQEEIKQSLTRYANALDEATDSSAFK